MQLIIDTLKDSKDDIEKAIVFLGSLYGIGTASVCAKNGTASAKPGATGVPASPLMHPDDVDPDPIHFTPVTMANHVALVSGNVPPAPSTAAANPFSTAPVVMPGTSTVPPAPLLPTVPTAPLPMVAPTAPVVTGMPAHGVELDAEGLPWDSRIHAATKTKIKATGNWKVKKGLNDDALLKSVRDELFSLRQLPPAAPPQATPPVAPSPAPMATPTAPIATGPRPAPQNATEFMPRITPAMVCGELSQPRLIEVLNAYGVPTLPSLAHTPHLVPAIWATLQQECPSLQ